MYKYNWNEMRKSIRKTYKRLGTRQKALHSLIERINSQIRSGIIYLIYRGHNAQYISDKLDINYNTWVYYIRYNASDEFKDELKRARLLRSEYVKEQKVRKVLRGK